MELWIARDEIGLIAIYKREPYKKYDTLMRKEYWCIASSCGDYMCLPDESFPEVTFENSPKKVEIKLVEE